MSDENTAVSAYRSAIRLIDSQRKLLIEAGAQKEVLDAYTRVVRHLNKIPQREILKVMGESPANQDDGSRVDRSALRAMSTSEIEALVADEKTPRKLLELIAIYRFSVPSGSMRSFSNVASLREKISTLVGNERGHEIIESVARHSGHPPPPPPRRS